MKIIIIKIKKNVQLKVKGNNLNLIFKIFRGHFTNDHNHQNESNTNYIPFENRLRLDSTSQKVSPGADINTDDVMNSETLIQHIRSLKQHNSSLQKNLEIFKVFYIFLV